MKNKKNFFKRRKLLGLPISAVALIVSMIVSAVILPTFLLYNVNMQGDLTLVGLPNTLEIDGELLSESTYVMPMDYTTLNAGDTLEATHTITANNENWKLTFDEGAIDALCDEPTEDFYGFTFDVRDVNDYPLKYLTVLEGDTESWKHTYSLDGNFLDPAQDFPFDLDITIEKLANYTSLVGQADLYLNLDDSGLTARDLSGGNHHGILTNMEIEDWCEGKIDGALDFGGIDEHIIVPDSTVGDYDLADPFSITFWMNSAHTHIAIANKMDENQGWLIFTDNNELRFRLSSDENHIIQVLTSITNDVWQFIACVYDGSATAGGMEIYIDNILIPSIATDDNMDGQSIKNTLNPSIGNAGSFDRWMVGKLDQFTIWGKCLDTTEIAWLWNNGDGVDFC